MALEWSEDELPFSLTDLDRAHLALRDDEFHAQTWDELKQVIGSSTDVFSIK